MMALEDLAVSLGLKRTGSEWKGPCVLCGGTDRSWLRVGRTGNIIFRCRHCGDEPFRWLLKTRGNQPVFQKDRVATGSKPPTTSSNCVTSLWTNAVSAPRCLIGHPYADRKGITENFGARRARYAGDDVIVVPQVDIRRGLIGLELINAEGNKKTLGNKGHFLHATASAEPAIVHVVEGWATGYAINKYFPQFFPDRACIVAIAFGSNLVGLGSKMAKSFPEHIVVPHYEPNNRDFWDIAYDGDAEAYVLEKVRALREAGEL